MGIDRFPRPLESNDCEDMEYIADAVHDAGGEVECGTPGGPDRTRMGDLYFPENVVNGHACERRYMIGGAQGGVLEHSFL